MDSSPQTRSAALTARDRKPEIERAALDLAYQHGPATVSTGMIAKQIGLSQPAIYKHFKRKEDIWQAVASRLALQIEQNISESFSKNLLASDRLRKLVRAHLAFLGKNPALPEIMAMRADAENSFQHTIQSAMRGFHRALTRHVELGQKQNHYRKNIIATDAATLVLGLVQSLVLRSLISRDLEILNNDGERLLDLLLAGFAQQGDAQ